MTDAPAAQLYAFHRYTSAGAGVGLDMVELASDEAALAYAFQVLQSHSSCDYVVVWDGDRRVLTRHRVDPSLQAMLSRTST